MSNTEQVIAVLGHENMHATGERSEVVAGRAEDQAMNAWESENAFNGNTTGGGYDSGADFYVSQSDTATVKQGSQQAAGVEDVAAAYFAKRPLDGVPWLGPLSSNKLDDKSNTEISHEQLFFEDEKGGNIGFFKDRGVDKDDERLLNTYKPSNDTGYEDSIMRDAVKNVKPKEYSLCGTNQYNCQDWAQDVREEYKKLKGLSK